MKNYKDLVAESGLTLSVLYHRVHALKIKGLYIGQAMYFNDKQVKKILNYKSPERESFKYHKRKLRIVEWYERYKSARKVSYMLNIHRDYVTTVAKEMVETGGFITVESKMNRKDFKIEQ